MNRISLEAILFSSLPKEPYFYLLDLHHARYFTSITDPVYIETASNTFNTTVNEFRQMDQINYKILPCEKLNHQHFFMWMSMKCPRIIIQRLHAYIINHARKLGLHFSHFLGKCRAQFHMDIHPISTWCSHRLGHQESTSCFQQSSDYLSILQRVLTRTNSHIQGSNCGLMHLLPNKMQPSSIVGQERHRICLPTFSPDHHYFSSSVVKRYNGLSYSTTRINFPGVAKSNPPNFHQFHPYTSMSNTLHST